MRISIILPNFNGSKYLERAIRSFLEQSHDDKELVIVDGKSIDSSHEIISRYVGSQQTVRWLKEPDIGISDAVNQGNAAASGDILGFLGSDDALLPGALSRVASFANLVDFDGIYFNKYLYFVQERSLIRRPPPVNHISVEALLEHGTITDLQTIFYRRSVFDRYRHNPENKTCMDYELLLELARGGAFLAHVDDEVVLEYMDGNISHGSNQKQLDEAHAVALRFKGDYDGPMWSDAMTGRSVPTAADAAAFKEAYDDCERRFSAAIQEYERRLHEVETSKMAIDHALAEAREGLAAVRNTLVKSEEQNAAMKMQLAALRSTLWYRLFSGKR